MASAEFIAKRIEGKEKELEKLNKKLQRICKVEAQNWADPNPYYYSERDLKYTLRDIEEAQKALDGYKAQLIAETEKANSRNVPAIVEFLNGWKRRVSEHYGKGLKESRRSERCITKSAADIIAKQQRPNKSLTKQHAKLLATSAADITKQNITPTDGASPIPKKLKSKTANTNG